MTDYNKISDKEILKGTEKFSQLNTVGKKDGDNNLKKPELQNLSNDVIDSKFTSYVQEFKNNKVITFKDFIAASKNLEGNSQIKSSDKDVNTKPENPNLENLPKGGEHAPIVGNYSNTDVKVDSHTYDETVQMSNNVNSGKYGEFSKPTSNEVKTKIQDFLPKAPKF